jgi:hypothetical protein
MSDTANTGAHLCDLRSETFDSSQSKLPDLLIFLRKNPGPGGFWWVTRCGAEGGAQGLDRGAASRQSRALFGL